MRRLVLLAGLVPGALAAQAPVYTRTQLQCVQYREALNSQLTIESSGQMGSATSGREGNLVLAAGAPLGDLRLPLVGWFDSLRVWRVAGTSQLEPDPAGIIGGQYRGELSPDGLFTSRERPFVPDELREVMDLGAVLDDLLPRLPPRALQVGEEWRAGDSLAIQRLADSASLQRYRVRLSRSGDVPAPPGDTLTPAYSRDLTDDGTAVWSQALGPVRYDRRTTVVARVPAGGPVKRAVRSQLEQRSILERLAHTPDCREAGFTAP